MIRDIQAKDLTDLIKHLCIQANTILPEDIRNAVNSAAQSEDSPVGCSILQDLKENWTFAEQKGQDTGMAVVFLDWGQDCHLVGGSLEDAVNAGVAQGYVEGFLRLSVVADPIRRGNTGDNTPAILHLKMVPGDQVSVTIAPKGFGSENMTKLRMFKPSVSQGEIEDFIVSCVSEAGSNPCPPVVVGVGLGGTSETAVELAKRALLRPAGQPAGHRPPGVGRAHHGAVCGHSPLPHPHRRPPLCGESGLPRHPARPGRPLRRAAPVWTMICCWRAAARRASSCCATARRSTGPRTPSGVFWRRTTSRAMCSPFPTVSS